MSFMYCSLLSQLSGNGVWKSPHHPSMKTSWDENSQKGFYPSSLKSHNDLRLFSDCHLLPPQARCVHSPWQIYFKGSLHHDPFSHPATAVLLSNMAQSSDSPMSQPLDGNWWGKRRAHTGEPRQPHEEVREVIAWNIAHMISLMFTWRDYVFAYSSPENTTPMYKSSQNTKEGGTNWTERRNTEG